MNTELSYLNKEISKMWKAYNKLHNGHMWKAKLRIQALKLMAEVDTIKAKQLLINK